MQTVFLENGAFVPCRKQVLLTKMGKAMILHSNHKKNKGFAPQTPETDENGGSHPGKTTICQKHRFRHLENGSGCRGKRFSVLQHSCGRNPRFGSCFLKAALAVPAPWMFIKPRLAILCLRLALVSQLPATWQLEVPYTPLTPPPPPYGFPLV